jgi:hypothetical protein
MKAKIEMPSSFLEKILNIKFVTEILELPYLFECPAHEVWVRHCKKRRKLDDRRRDMSQLAKGVAQAL